MSMEPRQLSDGLRVGDQVAVDGPADCPAQFTNPTTRVPALCTRANGHDGQHVAVNADFLVVELWHSFTVEPYSRGNADADRMDPEHKWLCTCGVTGIESDGTGIVARDRAQHHLVEAHGHPHPVSMTWVSRVHRNEP